MPSRSSHIRWDPLVYDFIAFGASRSGVSFNEFVRDAALVRAAFVFAASNPADVHELMTLYTEAHAALERLGEDH